jgi:hypothetical protein
MPVAPGTAKDSSYVFRFCTDNFDGIVCKTHSPAALPAAQA